jgi:DNA polymerase (family 10)
MDNLKVAGIFKNIADILEMKDENRFRIRAYQRAADTIEGMAEDFESLVNQDRLTEIPGIGRDLSEKIKEIVTTGKLKFYEDLKKSIPEGLLELLNIPSVGPKTAKLLYDELKIKNIKDLEAAIKKNKLKSIFGIKEKTVENIAKGIAMLKRGRERMPLAAAMQVADEFLSALQKLKEVKNISPAGSLRRRKETVRDIDILVISDKPQKVMDEFTGLPQVKEILARGETKSSVRTADDIQIDCRVVEEKSFGAALLYFTGSKNFNIHIRMMAQKNGLKINEYGVFRKEKFIAGRTEEEIFKFFKMAYIEPELREDTGEIELALKDKLPQLLKLEDIKADLHVHSRWSDGANTIEELVRAAKARGYSYIGVTDHSQSLKVAHGMSVADLKKKKKEIDGINKNLKGFRVLYGTEVDIDSDGNIDYKDEVLKEFDFVVAAIHIGFKQSREKLTHRIIKACENKYVHIIAHPTGRLWGTRDAYELDFNQILKVAKETNTHLEINAFPQRLDLNDQNCRLAKEKGVKLVINTDAHSIEHLENMQLGIYVGRRGWLTRDDVLNTLEVDKLLKLLKK